MVNGDETFAIKDLQVLHDGSISILNRCRNLKERMVTFNQIINRIEENWQNKLGSDVASALQNLRMVEKNLNDNIIPSYEDLARCIGHMADSAAQIQQKSI